MSNKLFSSFCGSCSMAVMDFNKKAAPVEAAPRHESPAPAGITYEI